MMYPITLGDTQPSNKFKFCNKCNENKPPEGGVDMGAKWHCQFCWIRRFNVRNTERK